MGYFRSGAKALKAEGTTPELLRIADTPLDALAYAQVVVLLFVLCQAAADAGRVLKEWEDHVLASLNGDSLPRARACAPCMAWPLWRALALVPCSNSAVVATRCPPQTRRTAYAPSRSCSSWN